MAETYDIIIVGGGHNGLSAALELARAGRSVLIVEAQPKIGGCATTIEPLLPGFRHSPHANALIFDDLMPDRLRPARLQVRLLQPEAQFGVAFADGRPPLILHRPDLLSHTVKCLATYSPDDAATYFDLKRRSAKLGSVIRTGLYAAPDLKWFRGQVEAVRQAYKGCCDMRSLGGGSARSLIDELFGSPEIRLLFYSLALETGIALEERGGDVAFLGYSLWIAGRWRVPSGGMGVYTEALGNAAVTAGVTIACSTPAARILLETGRAIGVETAGGDILLASQAVLGATPILHIYEGLLCRDAITQKERDELAAFKRQQPGSIASSFFCLEQAPRYKSALHNPEIDQCLKTVVGHETPDDLLAQIANISAGLLPKPAGVVRLHSLWDGSQAPAGFHAAGVDSSFPAAHNLDLGSWRMVEAAFPQAFLDMWSRYCVDGLAVPLAMSCDISSPFERRLLLRTGPGQYRSSVSGLYLGGPGVYPGGGVHGACGINAARTILADCRTAS